MGKSLISYIALLLVVIEWPTWHPSARFSRSRLGHERPISFYGISGSGTVQRQIRVVAPSPRQSNKLSRTTNHLPTTKTAKFRSSEPSSISRPATQQVGCSAVVIGFSLHRIPSYATSSAWQSVLLRKRITGVFNFVVRQLEILEIPRNWIDELWFPLFYSALHVATGLCHETARHIRRPK